VYAAEFHSLGRRKSLLADASAIAPRSLVEFDNNPRLFNCANGTYDLDNRVFRPHNAADNITKIARVEYKEDASCVRWVEFIDQVIPNNPEIALFLKMALGYALTGDTSQDCFFLLLGPSTRNGKSTLTETIAHIMGDYAATAQPQTIARRPANGAAPSPDIARLKGARFVNMPEPAKGLELDAALVKQLTGGDALTARFLFKNPTEYRPTFKIFIGANHMPRINDRTVFSSGRLKVIPFNRHFKPEEQERGLKQFFCKPSSMSGILNWLLDGFVLFRQEGNLTDPETMRKEIENLQRESMGDLDGFLKTHVVKADAATSRLKTKEIYDLHCKWARERDFTQMSPQAFVGELRSRYKVQRFTTEGNAITGYALQQQGDGCAKSKFTNIYVRS
jgi:putative DNA primase/helicase